MIGSRPLIISLTLLFLLSFIFSGCGGGTGSGSVESSGLPPDPGAAGLATLAGVDSDNDGVRDDIQRFIALNYQNSEKTQKALSQMVLAFQEFVVNTGTKETAMQNMTDLNRAIECIHYVQPSNASQIINALKAKVLNTQVRTETYVQNSDFLGGEVFPIVSPTNFSSSCNFDPDALIN